MTQIKNIARAKIVLLLIKHEAERVVLIAEDSGVFQAPFINAVTSELREHVTALRQLVNADLPSPKFLACISSVASGASDFMHMLNRSDLARLPPMEVADVARNLANSVNVRHDLIQSFQEQFARNPDAAFNWPV